MVIAIGESPAPTASPAERSPQGRTRLANPALFGVVAIVAFDIHFQTDAGLDPSWRLGLGWLRQRGLDHGGDIVFTYGPLGPLAVPTLAASAWWIAAALVASIASAIWFARVILRAVRLDQVGWWAPGIAIGAALLAGRRLGFTDFIAITTVVDVHSRLPGRVPAPPRTARLAGYGALLAAMGLCKLNAGVIVAAALAVLAIAWPGWRRRARAVAIVVVSAALTGLGLWVVTGGGLDDLELWVRGSVDILSGYSTSMAFQYTGRWTTTELVLLGTLVALLVGGLVRRRRDPDGVAHWSEPLLMGVTAWFLLKGGLVRFDGGHVKASLVGIAILVIALAGCARRPLLGLAALLLACLGLMTPPPAGWPTRFDAIASGWSEQPAEAWDAAIAVLSGSDRARLTEDARDEIRAFYAQEGLRAPVLSALEGRRVHAEQWDVGALWAHHLTWHPLPVFQTYAAYTPYLDGRNAERLRDPELGPDAVLLSTSRIDGRVAAWDSPAARLEMACHFEVVAEEGSWSALHRAPDVCGPHREITTIRAHTGEVVLVPAAGQDELVVATFDVHPSLSKRALDLLARDPALPMVTINTHRARFVPAAASSPHLLRVPDRFRGRDLPGGPLEVDSLGFENLGGPVDVTFYAVPLS